MNINQEINDRIAQLHNVIDVQNKSISELYKQSSQLVESNSKISKEIEFLYASMRVNTGSKQQWITTKR